MQVLGTLHSHIQFHFYLKIILWFLLFFFYECTNLVFLYTQILMICSTFFFSFYFKIIIILQNQHLNNKIIIVFKKFVIYFKTIYNIIYLKDQILFFSIKYLTNNILIISKIIFIILILAPWALIEKKIIFFVSKTIFKFILKYFFWIFFKIFL